MSNLDSINDDISKAPAFKFDTIGTTFKGTIVSGEKRQQTDFQTGEPKFWRDGSPMWEYVLTCDEQGTSDRYRLFARGHMWKALKEAMQGQRLEVGGTLTIKYTGDGTPSSPGMSPPKQYAAKWEPPIGVFGDDEDPF